MGTKAAKKNRTRNHQVNFYMNDEEYRKLTKLVTESGLNKQTYLINATLGATLANPEALKDIPKLLSELTELLNQFKGIGINCICIEYKLFADILVLCVLCGFDAERICRTIHDHSCDFSS